jgi:DNA-directed RNA polymerase subunit RPC12/RpoP
MERNLSSLKFEVEDSMLSTVHASSTCSACGEVFEAPLLAMVFSDYLVEEYYACPKCLSKVRSVEHRESFEVDDAGDHAEEEVSALNSQAEEAVADSVGCAHHLGFLKVRPKSTPIPEECLTCSKMIECMY